MSFMVEQVYSTEAVEELYAVVYPGKERVKFNWLYFKNPAGNADIFVIKDTVAKKVIGTYCFIPMKLCRNGTPLLIGQAIDGMVHPDYRDKHIFNRLVAEVFPIVTKKYAYLIGFPNNRSRGSLIRAGWIHLGDLDNFSFPLNKHAFTNALPENIVLNRLGKYLSVIPLWLYKRFYRSRGKLPASELQLIQDDEVTLNEIVQLIEKRNPVMFSRDADLIRWRLLSIPQENYSHFKYIQNNDLQGFISIKTENSHVELIDFIVNPDKKHIQTALSLLISKAEEMKAEALHLQISQYAYLTEHLRSCGFIRRPGENAVIVFPGNSPDLKLQWNEMYLSLADTDWL